MITIWTENQVSLIELANHIEQIGLQVVKREDSEIVLITELGLNFRLSIDQQRKFLRFATYLPLDRERTYESKLNLVQRFSHELFLATFALDTDDDLLVLYYMSYVQGLNVSQFMKVLQRYSTLLDHIVNTKNESELIKFPSPANDEDETDHEETDSADIVNSSRSANILLN